MTMAISITLTLTVIVIIILILRILIILKTHSKYNNITMRRVILAWLLILIIRIYIILLKLIATIWWVNSKTCLKLTSSTLKNHPIVIIIIIKIWIIYNFQKIGLIPSLDMRKMKNCYKWWEMKNSSILWESNKNKIHKALIRKCLILNRWRNIEKIINS